MSGMASFKLRRSSRRVRPWELTPGISSTVPMYYRPFFSIIAVNSRSIVFIENILPHPSWRDFIAEPCDACGDWECSVEARFCRILPHFLAVRLVDPLAHQFLGCKP